MSVKICDHCGDTPLTESGKCPVCVQQVLYQGSFDKPFPLAIHRGPMANFKSDRPFGRSKRCAVVAETETEYLTACGAVERKGHSVAREAPNCPSCRATLRRVAKL